MLDIQGCLVAPGKEEIDFGFLKLNSLEGAGKKRATYQ
jgi:hypothetical protein